MQQTWMKIFRLSTHQRKRDGYHNWINLFKGGYVCMFNEHISLSIQVWENLPNCAPILVCEAKKTVG